MQPRLADKQTEIQHTENAGPLDWQSENHSAYMSPHHSAYMSPHMGDS